MPKYFKREMADDKSVPIVAQGRLSHKVYVEEK